MKQDYTPGPGYSKPHANVLEIMVEHLSLSWDELYAKMKEREYNGSIPAFGRVIRECIADGVIRKASKQKMNKDKKFEEVSVAAIAEGGVQKFAEVHADDTIIS